MLKVETHVIKIDGSCGRCGIKLPIVTFEGNQIGVHEGDPIGVISGLHDGASAYLIRTPEHDTNPKCQPMK